MISCVKCGNHSFKLELFEPTGGAYKLYAVACSSCGGVVGVTEFNNIGAMIERQNKVIRKIVDHLGVMLDYRDRDFGG
jgi:predicted nucleic-acid-binding Zn-ribbon protein